jgi:hypothetical protein
MDALGSRRGCLVLEFRLRGTIFLAGGQCTGGECKRLPPRFAGFSWARHTREFAREMPLPGGVSWPWLGSLGHGGMAQIQ